jgi:hypothetical protein
MNISFEDALSRLANDPTDLVSWSVVLDAFEDKVSSSRTINGNLLTGNITLDLDSDDFINQGTTTTVLHGNAAGNPSWGAIVTNDITAANVTLPKIQNISTSRILGRLTAGSGTIEQLTGTQLTTLLDVFSTSTTTKGVVPGSNNLGTSYFLRADGIWAVPTGTSVDHSTLTKLTYADAGHTGFEPTLTAGTSAQYYRGDKTWQNLATEIAAALPTHNTLTGLEGGSGGHYYHVSAAQSVSIGIVTTTSADTVPTGLTCSATTIVVSPSGTVSATVTLTWDAIATSTFDHYQIRYKRTAVASYNYINSNTNTIILEGLVPNTSYDFGVASVNKYGTVSAFCADITQTTATSTTAPATVVGVIATAAIQAILLKWTDNAELDLDSYNIYRNTINDSATATLVANFFGNVYMDNGLPANQIHYYWFKALNTSGLESASFSSEAHATTRNVTASDVENIAADQVIIQGLTTIASWVSPGVTTIDGDKITAASITASKISTTTLSSITANLGSVTAGDIVISTGGTDKIWLNDASDGSIAVGGLVKASAPFRVTSAGVMTAALGTIGGWTVDADSIYHGTKLVSPTQGYTTAAGDITMRSDGSIHAKKFYINADGSAMISGLNITHLIPKSGAASLRHSDDAEEMLSNTNWAKVKQFQFTDGLLGQIRVWFSLKKFENSPGDAYGRIYKNGVAYGTQQTATAAYQVFSEDFTFDWEPGDTCELWVYSASGVDVYVQEFRIGYDNNFTVAVAAVNT